ncbi:MULTISPECIES: hypothetical protein [Burkholderia]|uniref:Ricin B lectin domain-containing protein n=2 Tax=Burkholderia TaxID=32008 RepID=A0AAW3Q3N2_9BURK|nr:MULTISPECIES: hypothetical protein [Burkholderia]MEB2502926.1 hypothetical protein [Burkholderia anthinoferrum]MEB2532147.1 hypothetical protein [Burkholderia anthinoferrum]MEB2560620.1 hypothetical protein [Burkholderia anthinoferrum]MEB2579279.1 hypothetical protein [Burkholderia anthinoferrum]KVE09213.1 hypothetical protein WS65_08050 [Burkholderia anthina]
MSDVIIEFAADRSRCIGVVPDSGQSGFVGPNSPLALRYLTEQDVLNVWHFRASPGFFILDFTSPDSPADQLAIDFKDGKVAAETPLVVRKFTGAVSQRWSLTMRPGYITSVANPNLVIDDHFDSLQGNNVIWAFAYNGTQAQHWRVTKVLDALAAKAPQYA